MPFPKVTLSLLGSALLFAGCGKVEGDMYVTFGAGDVKPAAGAEVLLLRGGILREAAELRAADGDQASRQAAEVIKARLREAVEVSRRKLASLSTSIAPSLPKDVETGACLSFVEKEIVAAETKLRAEIGEKSFTEFYALTRKGAELAARAKALSEKVVDRKDRESLQSTLEMTRNELAEITAARMNLQVIVEAAPSAKGLDEARRLHTACTEFLEAVEAGHILATKLEALSAERYSDGGVADELQAEAWKSWQAHDQPRRGELRRLLATSVVQRVRTSKDGHFVFGRVRPGSYVIAADYETNTGMHQSWLVPVSLFLSTRQDLSNFNMNPESLDMNVGALDRAPARFELAPSPPGAGATWRTVFR